MAEITNEDSRKIAWVKQVKNDDDNIVKIVAPNPVQIGTNGRNADLTVHGLTTLSGSSPALVTHGDILVTGSIYTTDGGGKANLWSHSDVSAGDIYYNDGDVGVGTNDPQTTLQVGSVVPSATDHADAILGAAEIGSRPGTPTDVIFGNTALDHSAGTTNYALKQTAAGFTSLNSPTILQISNAGATSMLITADGKITAPNQPGFLARASSDQFNLPVGTETTIAFGTESYDIGSNFSSNTFTAPADGRYYFGFSIDVRNIDTVASWVEIMFTKNAGSGPVRWSGWILDPGMWASDLVYYGVSANIILNLDSGDTVEIQYFQSGGATQTDIDSYRNGTYFTGYLLG